MPHKSLESRNSYHRAYYKAHKDVINARSTEINKRRRHERYAKVQALKEASPCCDCGLKYPYYVMDFDHRDPSAKVAEIPTLVKRCAPWPKVLEEIAKCDLVCTNCHRLRTYKGQNAYKTRRFNYHRSILDELKATTPCLDCDKLFQPCQVDFDHLGSKTANIARLVAEPTELLLQELSKCCLVCANCHRVRTFTKVHTADDQHLICRFQEIQARIPYPEDQRFVPFPYPHLLGVVPNRELSDLTGISQGMVAWYRRKARSQFSNVEARA